MLCKRFSETGTATQKSKKYQWKAEKRQKNGASERIRTVDSHVGNVILYQLSYTRIFLFY